MGKRGEGRSSERGTISGEIFLRASAEMGVGEEKMDQEKNSSR